VSARRGPAGEPTYDARCGVIDSTQGVLFVDWAATAEQSIAVALRGVAQLVGASRALAGALERAGAISAARCLAARFADARRASEREGRAAGSPGFTERLLLVHEQHVLEVRTR